MDAGLRPKSRCAETALAAKHQPRKSFLSEILASILHPPSLCIGFHHLHVEAPGLHRARDGICCLQSRMGPRVWPDTGALSSENFSRYDSLLLLPAIFKDVTTRTIQILHTVKDQTNSRITLSNCSLSLDENQPRIVTKLTDLTRTPPPLHHQLAPASLGCLNPMDSKGMTMHSSQSALCTLL